MQNGERRRESCVRHTLGGSPGGGAGIGEARPDDDFNILNDLEEMVMDIVLDPPEGVGPVWLGMTLDEAMAAVSPWGPHRIDEEFDYFDDEDEDDEDTPEEGEASKTVYTALQEIRVNVLLEGSGEAVTAVELWWPGEGRQNRRSGASRR
ncbi:hypothetical protein OHT93_31590 [Streptomyces sp. NBC_00191]|uniref:hypothetical protein n=1 Tax=Streptomyces sp. NBC_00191 TaxID=2975674 RepID=UPI0032474C84